VRVPLTAEPSIGEVIAHPIAGPLILQSLASGPAAGMMGDPSIMKMMASAPIGRMMGMAGNGDASQLEQLLAVANQ
jgi:beta-glucosidase